MSLSSTLAAARRTRTFSVTACRQRFRTGSGRSGARRSRVSRVRSRRGPIMRAAAIFAAAMVFGTGEFVSHHGVTNNEAGLRWQPHGAIRERAAIEHQGMIFATKTGNKLVHDAARHAHKVIFGALAKKRQLYGLQKKV